MPDQTVDDYSFAGLGLNDGRLRRVLDTIPQMAWSTDAEGQADFFNARWYAFTGAAEGTTDGDKRLELVHPDDREQAAAAWLAAHVTGESFSVEYRLRRHDGEWRWVIDRGAPLAGATGAIARWLGTCTEIEDLKRAEAANAMIAGELSHRIGNLFSVIIGLVSLSVPRGTPFRADAEKLAARLAALARAHDRFRAPQRYGAGGPASSLRDLVAGVMKPYQHDDDDDDEACEPRIAITGDDPPVTEQQATALALVLHELATNAVKHGALSVETGRVVIAVADEPGGYRLSWREEGGPPVAEPAGVKGFGSGLVRRLAVLQLGHEPQFHWHREGLEVAVRVAVK